MRTWQGNSRSNRLLRRSICSNDPYGHRETHTPGGLAPTTAHIGGDNTITLELLHREMLSTIFLRILSATRRDFPPRLATMR